MNYSNIIYNDTGNSNGISTTLFVSGCDMNCLDCHNKDLQDFDYGKPFTKQEENEIIESLKNPHVKYFVLSGGQPCAEKNLSTVIEICKRVAEETNVKIILYSGYKIENIDKNLIDVVDYVIDGAFESDKILKELDLRGSWNQQCYETINIGKDMHREYTNISETYFKKPTMVDMILKGNGNVLVIEGYIQNGNNEEPCKIKLSPPYFFKAGNEDDTFVIGSIHSEVTTELEMFGETLFSYEFNLYV